MSANPMPRGVRRAILVLLIAVASPCFAQSMPSAALDAIRALSLAGTELISADLPHGTTAPTTVAAIAQLTPTSAAIVIAAEIRPGAYGVVARSKPFSLSREANFGATVEQFRFTKPDRFELSFSSRNGCARTVATHRFAWRQGEWLAVGLDTSAMRCTDNGVEQDRTESINYLTGRSVLTTFSPAGVPRTTQLRTNRRPFALSEFPPSGPEAIYTEMQ